MGKRCLIGIDVGTTGTKALLFSEDGGLLAQAYRSYPTTIRQSGLREQDAEDWWDAVVETIRQVCAETGMADAVAAVSLSTQGGTVVPVDRGGVPLRPAIVWSDTRCAAQQEAFLLEIGSAETMYQKTGWALQSGLPALQIRRLREQEPETVQKTAMFLTVPDYLSMKLTGRAAIDLSNAGINQLADVRAGSYDGELLRFVGVTEQQLPEILHSGEIIGHLTREAAAALGLREDAVLVSGAHDQYAAALGAGALRDGDAVIGSGTCWVVTAIRSQPDFGSGLSQSAAAVPGLWGSLRSLPAGGICLDWLRRNIMLGKNEESLDYDALNAGAAACKAAEEGLFFFPFSESGGSQKTPPRAAFTGLELHHDRFHMARAVMEGVVFQTVWMMEQFPARPGGNGLCLTGGASRSREWSQILADISGLPVRIPGVADLGCVGAAILAGVGSGIYENASEGYRHLAVAEQILQPQPENAAQCRALLAQYKHQAELLCGLYHQQAQAGG